MSRAERITKALRAHDRQLRCARNPDGVLSVYREARRFDRFAMDDGTTLVFSRPDFHLIFCLTEGWTMKGKPVDWGIEPILAKIRASDLWHRNIVKDLEEQDARSRASEERDLRNKNEAFFSDARPVFRDAFKDINVASLDKTEKQKRLRDKNAKYKS